MTMKTALITGASSDTGAAVAKALASGGFNIAAHYFGNIDAVRAIEKDADESGVKTGLFKYDLINPDNARDMVGDVKSQFGSIDVLVNTVGPFHVKNILEVTPEEWRKNIDTNLTTAFNVIYYSKDHICASKGHIINFAFAGVQNLKSWPMGAGYFAAKAGIVVLSKSLAESLASYGVRVNVICPGLLEGSDLSEQERQQRISQVPFGRLGEPQEVGDVVKWLVMESPSYISGALIPVSGAWEN